MSNIFKMFEMDKSLETQGIEVDYGDVKVTLARAGGSNVKFREVFKRKSQPYRKQIDMEVLDDDVSRRIMAESYAETVIKDMKVKSGNTWKTGVPQKKGAAKPFTEANVVAFLLELPELFTDIVGMASKASNFAKNMDEVDEKN